MGEFQYDQGVMDGRAEAAAMHRRELGDLIRELRELHKPYTVCWVCDDDYMEDHDESHEHYIVCAQCCANNGYHTQECADEHAGMTLAEHCPTIIILDRYGRSNDE